MRSNFMKKVEYLSYYIPEQLRKYMKAKERKQLFGKKIMDNNETSNAIQQLLNDGKPAMICRFGSVEAGALDAYIRKQLRLQRRYSEKTYHTMTNNAGFFAPEGTMEQKLDQFGQEMLDACRDIDLIGVWNPCEPFILKHYASEGVMLCRLGGLAPKSARPNPWTRALAGKKVLVIHPFADSIQKQYARKNLVFPNGFLPDFELHTIKAVQTAAGETDSRFDTWFDALAYMKSEMDKVDYDVALIGCGAYGFLLAQHAKQQGKIGLHVGGALQMVFGIYGKRWESNTKHAMNEYWVRPSEEETPKNAKGVEGGCYW